MFNGLTHLIAFFASFVFIFLKALQQRNVAFDNYWWVMPTSMAMAAVEIYIIAAVAVKGWSVLLWLSIGLGSGIGALVAMHFHRRYIKHD